MSRSSRITQSIINRLQTLLFYFRNPSSQKRVLQSRLGEKHLLLCLCLHFTGKSICLVCLLPHNPHGNPKPLPFLALIVFLFCISDISFQKLGVYFQSLWKTHSAAATTCSHLSPWHGAASWPVSKSARLTTGTPRSITDFKKNKGFHGKKFCWKSQEDHRKHARRHDRIRFTLSFRHLKQTH